MLMRLFGQAKDRLSKAAKETEKQVSELRALAEVIQAATGEARKQREELRLMRDAYASIASQLATMANSAGFLWHKDRHGRFIFASQQWCEFFWNDTSCDVEGLTDEELAEKFLLKHPSGVFTFGRDVCIGSDEITITKKKRCRFLECGVIKTSPKDQRPHVVLQTDKTPLYDKQGQYVGIVGMAMQMNCEDCKRNLKEWLQNSVVEKINDTLYYIHDELLHECELPIEVCDVHTDH